MKKVVVIGGGISGVFASIRIKELHPDYQVSIFEHNNRLLKKIYATGNGKCNFANIGSLIDKYSNSDFALPIINEFNAKDIINYFDNIGVKHRLVDELVYPYSESAETIANKLLERVDSLGIDVHLETEVTNYFDKRFTTNKGDFPYDVLIISVGGKSSPQLGSTGDMFDILIKHGYKIRKTNPSLCPIKTRENTKMVDGVRCKSLVSLYQQNNLIHQERGELLFKKDGLSGMVIFNMCHYINRLSNFDGITLHIDFAPGMSGDLDSLVQPKLAKYLTSNNLDFHSTVFTFKSFYDYQFSQVTSGGISVGNLDNYLRSKLENNVFFIGEVVDVDAVCGGYNMMWAFASAEKVSRNV